MKLEYFGIKDLMLITPEVYHDSRGYFFEVMRTQKLKEIGIVNELVQMNQSYSVKNVIRGLHYQTHPKAQGKFVRVVEGRVIDIALDIRPGSDTFLKWQSVILSSEIPQLFWIPRGFAHGFGVLSDSAILEYQCDEYYSPLCDAGILYNDKDLGIDWGITNPIVSDKDKNLKPACRIDFNFMGEQK